MRPICILCGGGRTSRYADENGFVYLRCESCELVGLHPQPDEAEVRGWYQCAHGATFNHQAEISLAEEKGIEARHRYRIVQRALRGATRRALEVGCGAGYFLRLLRRQGWEVMGTEAADAYIQFARASLGLDVRSDLQECTGPFGAIFLFNVLSHLTDPQRDLIALAEKLAPGGVMVLETGNAAEVSPDRVGHLGAPDHVFHYSQANVRTLLERCGFQEVSVRRFNVEWQRKFLRLNPEKSGRKSDGAHSGGSSGEPKRKPAWKRIARSLLSHVLLALRYNAGRILADRRHYCTLIAVARK